VRFWLRTVPTATRDDAERPSRPSRLDDEGPPLRDAGTTLLGAVSSAVLTIVAVAWLVGAVDRGWILIPAIGVALALTAIVLAVVLRLLDEE
jgi:hypothetical protein